MDTLELPRMLVFVGGLEIFKEDIHGFFFLLFQTNKQTIIIK